MYKRFDLIRIHENEHVLLQQSMFWNLLNRLRKSLNVNNKS